MLLKDGFFLVTAQEAIDESCIHEILWSIHACNVLTFPHIGPIGTTRTGRRDILHHPLRRSYLHRHPSMLHRSPFLPEARASWSPRPSSDPDPFFTRSFDALSSTLSPYAQRIPAVQRSGSTSDEWRRVHEPRTETCADSDGDGRSRSATCA